MNAMRMKLSARRGTVIAAILVASCVFSAVGYGASRLLAGPPSPAPGVANDVAALRTLPAPASVGVAIRNAVQAAASQAGGNPSTAIMSLRELLPDVGAGHSQLYAFRGPNGGVCFLLWKRMGTCPQGAQTFDKGLIWGVAGGYPAAAGNVPSAVLGVVADDVTSVTLSANGQSTSLPIVHNAFFAPLPDVPPSAPWNVQLVVAHLDGTSNSVVLPNPRH